MSDAPSCFGDACDEYGRWLGLWDYTGIVGLVWMLTFVPLMIIITALFLYSRDKQPVSSRDMWHCTAFNIILIILICGECVKMMVGRGNFLDCAIEDWFQTIIIMLLSQTFGWRCFALCTYRLTSLCVFVTRQHCVSLVRTRTHTHKYIHTHTHTNTCTPTHTHAHTHTHTLHRHSL